VKTACCAAVGSGCVGTCNGQGGTVLGAGCLDVYSSGWNGGQGRLATKNGINPYARSFGNAIGGGTTNAINRRLQVPAAEIVPNSAANLYFVEGVYVCTEETLATSMNNASYRRITMATAGGTPTLQGTIAQGIPAIRAWRDHGLGAGVVDNRVGHRQNCGQCRIASERIRCDERGRVVSCQRLGERCGQPPGGDERRRQLGVLRAEGRRFSSEQRGRVARWQIEMDRIGVGPQPADQQDADVVQQAGHEGLGIDLRIQSPGNLLRGTGHRQAVAPEAVGVHRSAERRHRQPIHATGRRNATHGCEAEHLQRAIDRPDRARLAIEGRVRDLEDTRRKAGL
jgi:hypothetical protein